MISLCMQSKLRQLRNPNTRAHSLSFYSCLSLSLCLSNCSCLSQAPLSLYSCLPLSLFCLTAPVSVCLVFSLYILFMSTCLSILFFYYNLVCHSLLFCMSVLLTLFLLTSVYLTIFFLSVRLSFSGNSRSSSSKCLEPKNIES